MSQPPPEPPSTPQWPPPPPPGQPYPPPYEPPPYPPGPPTPLSRRPPPRWVWAAIALIVAGVVAVIVIVSSSGGRGPEETVRDFVSALNDGDCVSANALLTPEARGSDAGNGCGNVPRIDITTIDLSDHGDRAATARVSYVQDGVDDVQVVELRKLGDDWFIDSL